MESARPRRRRLSAKPSVTPSPHSPKSIWTPSAARSNQRPFRKRNWLLDDWLNKYAGKIPLRQLKAADILSVCRRIEATGKYETAHRARALASRVMRYGVITGRVDRDPCADPVRMKMGEQHIVPLARQVVAILKKRQPITGDGPLLLPSLRSKKRPISDNSGSRIDPSNNLIFAPATSTFADSPLPRKAASRM